MKVLIGLIFTMAIFLDTTNAREITKSFKFGSYLDAKKSSEYIKFEMDSTKLGIITTTFQGYVKDFTVTLDKDANTIKDFKVAFDVKNLDTDIDARNEKMWNLCLDYKTFPNIVVVFKNDISLAMSEMIITPAVMKIRGKEKEFAVNIKTSKVNNKVIMEGNSVVKLSDLEIPDPSIFVASVNDQIKISFYFSE